MRYSALIKKSILVLVCICVFFFAHGQKQADSLRSLLPTVSDSNGKAKLLVNLAEELYQAGQRKDALLYAKEALNISEARNFPIEKGNALLLIGHAKLTENNYDSALLLLGVAEKCFAQANYTIGLTRAYAYLGQTYDVLARYDQAIQLLRRAQTIAEKESKPDKNRLANIHNSLGVSYLNKGSYELAIEHDYKALHFAEESGNKRLQAGILNNLGVVSIKVYNYHQALDNFRKLLTLAREQSNPVLIALALSNIGDCYAHTGDFRRAEEYLNQAIEARTKSKDQRGLTYTLSNLAYLRKQQQRLAESKNIYEQSLQLGRSFDENELLLSPLSGLATVNISLKKLDEAALQINEGRKIARTIGSKLWERDWYLLSSQLDSAKGDFRRAYQWYKKYTALNDSLFTGRKSLQVEEMKASYESERKDKEIQLLNEVKKREALKHQSDQRMYLVFIGVALILLIAVLFWLKNEIQTAKILNRQKQEVTEANEEMRSLIEKIEDQNESLALKNEKLEDMHREKDGMIGVVAHDLRSPLNKVVGLAELVTLTGSLNAEQMDMMARMKKVCDDGNNLIRDLMELHQLEDTSNEAQITSFEVVSTWQGWIDNYRTQLQNKHLSLKLAIGIERPMEVWANLYCITRVLDNIFTNAIKFSPTGKTIHFTLQADEKKLVFTIRDEGPGFQPNDMPHLFKKFKKLSARPTANEHSTGLGLSIVKALLEKVKGDIIVHSFPNEGATFIISIPVEFETFHAGSENKSKAALRQVL